MNDSNEKRTEKDSPGGGMAEELVDELAADGKVISTTTKSHAHKMGLLHEVVIGEVRDMHGNVVLVRQAHDRQDAGLLVSPVGGHVRAGESSMEAFKRELFEEIGVTTRSASQVGQFIFDREVLNRRENHLFTVFLIHADPASFVLGAEATAIEIFSPRDLQEHLAASPNSFGAAFLALVGAEITELRLVIDALNEPRLKS